MTAKNLYVANLAFRDFNFRTIFILRRLKASVEGGAALFNRHIFTSHLKHSMKKVILSFVIIVTGLFVTAQNITGVLGAFPPELVLLQRQMQDKKDTVILNIHFIK